MTLRTFRAVIVTALVLAAGVAVRPAAGDQPLEVTVEAGQSECFAEVFQVGDTVSRIPGLGTSLFVTSSVPTIKDFRFATGTFGCAKTAAGESKGSSFSPPSQVVFGGTLVLEASVTGSASAFGSSPGYADMDVGARSSVTVFNPNDFDVEVTVTIDVSEHGAVSNNDLGFFGVSTLGGHGANAELVTHSEVGPDGCRLHKLRVVRQWPSVPGPDPLLDSPVDDFAQVTDTVQLPSDPDCQAQRQAMTIVPAGSSRDLSNCIKTGLDNEARTTVTFDAAGSPIFRSGYALGSAYLRCTVVLQGAAPSPGAATLEVTAHSPVDLVVTDSNGRRAGFDLDRKQPIAEIPGARYTGHATEPQTVAIPFPAGDYGIQLTGIGDGPFTLTIRTLDVNGNELDRRESTGTITRGEQQAAQAHVNAAGTLGAAPPADTTAPITTASASPGPNANGWNNTDVRVQLNAVDETGGSGVKEIGFSLSGAQGGTGVVAGSRAAVTISAEGTTILTVFARDNAGNQAPAKTLAVRIDKTPPTVTFGSPTPAGNAAGWNNANVSISFTTADNLSGVAATTLPSPLVLTTEGRGTSQSVTVTDVAGNSATFTSPAVNIDRTPPTVACVRVSRQKQEDDESDGRLLFQVTASDTLSGVTTFTLGDVQLTNGEVIRIQPTRRPGVELVVKTDDVDDRNAPRIRRLRVGPGADMIKAPDQAGNVGTAVCPLPLRHDDDDEGKGDDRGRGRERARSGS